MGNKYMESIEKFSDSVIEALQELQDTLKEGETKEKGRQNIFALSLSRVRTIAQAGLVSDVFNVGDIIISDHKSGKIAWRVIGRDKRSVSLHMCHSLNERRTFGSCNNWEKSDIRSWLNDEKEGFLSGFSTDDAHAISPMEIITAKDGKPNKTVDRLYLLSRSEVGLGDENGVHEGDPFPYFAISGNRAKRYLENDDPLWWWLRSPYSGSAFSVRLVSQSGALGSGSAVSAHGVVAACTIR
ncbi:MAG: DUF6273 domain-containing protein [Clostridia bacterium]